ELSETRGDLERPLGEAPAAGGCRVVRHARRVELPEDDRELIPSDPRHEVVVADAPLDQLRGLLQDRVADPVAVPVVVVLEVVDIEEQQRYGETLAARLGDDLLEEMPEVSPVVATSQV